MNRKIKSTSERQWFLHADVLKIHKGRIKKEGKKYIFYA